ncbi:transcription repressor OFP13 [Silene latifolia]|uniref:transcription repressor OFP13 n=1 Tax=Silene latifolia TaxID=37657 RepID=UPI003D77B096
MGLKVKLLPSRFKVPSCTQQPKTSSFRLTATMKDDIFKTINSVYLDHESDSVETPDSWFTHSSELGSLGSASDEYDESSMSISGDSHLEDIVRGAQQSSSANHRLLFDPTAQQDSPKLGPRMSKVKSTEGSDVRKLTSSKTTQTRSSSNNINNVGYKESVAMCMESEDPYEDFKRSMEEMVESLKVRDDWEELEELLGWYLKVNGKKHHGYIISAFIDLLAQINIDAKNSSYSSSSDESSSDINSSSDCKNENVRSTTLFCSATSSLTSSCGNSTPDHL